MDSSIIEMFHSENFMPHGHCFLWQPGVLWLHLISDLVIFASYYSIPFGLVYFARKRPDMPFRLLFVLFSLFILLCGTTHLFSIWVLWHADYGMEGVVKALTAIASFGTAILVWKLMPQLLRVPSPSQLQQLNTELIVSQGEITHRVEERTLELADANRRLEDAYRVAEKASNAKSDFLANMSHEIRTPMNAVIGLSAILSKSEPLSDKQRQYIGTLRTSAESLMSLITDLLDISKIENEAIVLDHARFSMKRILDEVVSIISVKADEKGIAITMECDDMLDMTFVGDATRIRQVLLNVVSNAVKFTNAGYVHVHAHAGYERGSRLVYALVRVEDTGIGIPADKQEAIFSKFSQADPSVNRKYGGTGLGLPISKRLVELMGGSIRLESQDGKGTTFRIDLPLALAEESMPASEPSQAQVKPRPAPGGAKILLVEDYQPNILVAGTLLESMGYEYDVALNGQEALDKLSASDAFGLVLMDVQMPVMDGYTATRLIREREAGQASGHLPVIGFTAFAMAGDREKCLAAGMDDYLTKPFLPEELERKIASLLSSR